MKTTTHGAFTLHDFAPSPVAFEAEVIAGLETTPKRLPAKFFYDRAGSRLFEEICELPEYYLTRAELAILDRSAGEIAAALGERPLVVELGSGASLKTRRLLAAMKVPAGYVLIDIARDELLAQAAQLSSAFPGLELVAVCADYTRPFALPRPKPGTTDLCFYFPGSTIGNLEPAEAADFLRHLRRLADGPCKLLLGVDLKKAPARISAAYDDARGVTAAFNLNLLARINRELDGDFDLASFKHRAGYVPHASRVEMHLDSLREQRVRIGARQFAFGAGESICTEHSYKYDRDDLERLARAGGFELRASWTDPEQLFGVELLEAG